MGQHRCQPLLPRVAPTEVGLETPHPHLANALTRSSSPDSITVGPRGPGEPARPWVTMTTLVMLAAAHKPPAGLQLLQQRQQPTIPTVWHGGTPLPHFREQRTQILAEGTSPAPLTGRPGVPWGPGSPGKPFSPCTRREEQQDGEMLHPGVPHRATLHPRNRAGGEGAPQHQLQALPLTYFGSR